MEKEDPCATGNGLASEGSFQGRMETAILTFILISAVTSIYSLPGL